MRQENNNFKYLCVTVVVVMLIIFAPSILDRISIITKVTTLGITSVFINKLPKIIDSTANLVLAFKS